MKFLLLIRKIIGFALLLPAICLILLYLMYSLGIIETNYHSNYTSFGSLFVIGLITYAGIGLMKPVPKDQ
ncbi:MAG: hypothetical protein JXR19_03555 [Bacteroidia bacterium]